MNFYKAGLPSSKTKSSKRFIFRLVWLVAITSMTAGCASSAVKSPDSQRLPDDAFTNITLNDAQRMENEGRQLDAARAYSKLAASATAPQRQALKLRAAYVLVNGNYYGQAVQVLKDIDMNGVSKRLEMQYAFLQAKIAIADRNAEASQEWLSKVKLPENSTPDTYRDYYRVRIKINELTGNTGAAIRDRVLIEPYLQTDDDKEKNQQAIIQILSLLPADNLNQMREKATSPVLKGWIDLSLLAQRSQNPRQISVLLDKWKKDYPNHPARESILATLSPQADADTSPPALNHIALLLPFQGPFAGAAQAIRDGFFAAYYAQETAQQKPEIKLYDTGATPENVTAIYQKAIDEGATVVVGPLNKQAVNILARSTKRLPVPTIALNQVEDNTLFADDLYQFGLSPEDEAMQVAERAWLDGYNRAAVIYPEGSWGDRVYQTFKNQWEKLGGVVLDASPYNPKKNDFSKTIKSMLSVDQSNKRYRALSSLLRTKMDYEARRRQDIDFVFMAAFPRQARLIPPQLKFYHAGDIPVYSTSHSFSGKLDRGSDRDMNGVLIGDMPWTLLPKSDIPLKRQIAQIWPNSADQMARLYAMGVDAYNVLYYINWLRANPNARLAGATGNLYVDNFNHLQRKLTWAKFRNGIPRVIKTAPVFSAQ